MRFRKFEILGSELSPGGAGPERLYIVRYRAIKDKEWVEGQMTAFGRNAKEAEHKIQQRFGGKK